MTRMSQALALSVGIPYLLSGCGGGGSSSGPSVTDNPTSLSASAALNDATPTADSTVVLTLSNLPANAQYLGGRYSNNAISTVTLVWDVRNSATVYVDYKAPGSLAVGTYNDQVQIQLCADSACADAIANTTLIIPVIYQVLPIAPGNTPTVSFAQTQIAYQDLAMDFFPPPEINDTITLTNFGATPYLSVSNGGSVIARGFGYAQDPSAGTLTVDLTPAVQAGIGTWNVPLVVTVCLDPNCVNPVAGSPFTVDVSYTVGNSISVAGTAGYTLTPLQLNVRGMVWDPVHSAVYAETAGNSGYSITAIDPSTQQLGTQVALGANVTGAIDVSDDGEYLYVGLTNGTVQRYQLPGLTPDIVIPLGSNAQGATLYAGDVKVAPGSPHTIAVALSTGEFGAEEGNEAGVAIFDDAVQRPNSASATQNPSAGTTVDSLAWSTDATTLYGTGATFVATFNPGPLGLFTMSVDSQGISSTVHQGSFPSASLHLAGNLLYLDNGQIIDPTTAEVATTLSAYADLYGVIPDTSLDTLFISEGWEGSGGAPQLSALNLTSLAPIASILLPGMFMEQSQWLVASGGTLASPVIVVRSPGYLGFIAGAFASL